MRPLLRPPLPDQVRGRYTAASLLMSAFGHFCAFCERPLPDQHWVWNARTGTCLDRESYDVDDWPHLYLLDHNCHQAQQASSAIDPGTLLLPTAENVFDLRGESQLHYSLQPLLRTLLDDDARPVTHQLVPSVLIIGRSAPALATIDYFKLNTRYYDDETQTLRIPWQDHLSLEDRRMEQRTRTWLEAEALAKRVLRSFSYGLQAVVIQQFRQTAGVSGYWSAAATAAARMRDPELRRRIFVDAAEPAGRDVFIEGFNPGESALFRGSGPHHTFPGTRNIFE
ncbi:hypothetical protein ACIP1T_21785 [Pseudomonas japonica]|uniref:hypothetical protein n=1 Tax=Pseudomonas japonica TaxID=256466 RepID=UPI003828EC29